MTNLIKKLLDRISAFLKEQHSQRMKEEADKYKYTHYNQHPWCPETETRDQGDQL